MRKLVKVFSFVCIVLLLFNHLTLVVIAKSTEDLDIKAKSAILIEGSTGKILYEKNSHEKLPPASVTKVMTMLLIMEAIENNRISYDDIVVTSDYASSMGGSQVFLGPGEQMTVHDMLKAIAIASANDASVAMSEHIYGSEEAFVNAMNEKANELGMSDTTFVNCNGLDVENHLTSANDIALASRELLKYPKIHEYLTIWIDSLREGEFGLANTNKLIRFYKGANGIKTGSTSKALYCLSASAERDGMQLIAVVMAAPSSKVRFNNASKLLDYGFANYAVVDGAKKEEIIGKIEISKGVVREVELTPDSNFDLLVEKGRQGDIEKNINIADNVIAPVEKGQKVGEMLYYLDGEEIGKVNIVTKQGVDKISIGKVFGLFVKEWMNVQNG